MSQVSIIDIEGSHPQIPTEFIANIGSAIPIANMLEIYGDTAAAGTTPVFTVGSGNNITTYVQVSQALAASDITKIGLANFDSAAFSVDANGFVTLAGGVASTSFGVQANTPPGTNPVLVDAGGLVTINGAAVANHSVVLETRSRALNTFNIEVQYSAATVGSDATKSGVAHFDSTSFTVDANGFVQLTGGGLAIDSIHPDSGTDPVVPTAAGLVNIIGDGSTTTVGSLNTLTVQLTGLTNHAVLVGAGTTTITKVGPTATAGQVLQSAGAAADPAFSTATYPSTTTVSEILYSSATNVVSGLATANSATLVTNSTGIPVMSSTMTNGQVIIGSTGATPTAATLTAGTGMSITNAAGSITLNATGGALTWNDVTTTSASAAVNNGYLANNVGLVTITLPTTAAQFSIIEVAGWGAGGWTIAQNANQSIQFGSAAATTTGITGSLSSTNRYDTVKLIATVGGASTQWLVLSSIGNLTIV